MQSVSTNGVFKFRHGLPEEEEPHTEIEFKGSFVKTRRNLDVLLIMMAFRILQT
jgi:hypothetical protein